MISSCRVVIVERLHKFSDNPVSTEQMTMLTKFTIRKYLNGYKLVHIVKINQESKKVINIVQII